MSAATKRRARTAPRASLCGGARSAHSVLQGRKSFPQDGPLRFCLNGLLKQTDAFVHVPIGLGEQR